MVTTDTTFKHKVNYLCFQTTGEIQLSTWTRSTLLLTSRNLEIMFCL